MKIVHMLFVAALVQFACQPPQPANFYRLQLDEQIADRYAILTRLSDYNDSLAAKKEDIRTGQHKLLLLSKDLENFSACISMSRDFYNRLAMSEANIQSLTLLMSSREAEICLKENELRILNELIFRNSGADVRLFSAMEEEFSQP